MLFIYVGPLFCILGCNNTSQNRVIHIVTYYVGLTLCCNDYIINHIILFCTCALGFCIFSVLVFWLEHIEFLTRPLTHSDHHLRTLQLATGWDPSMATYNNVQEYKPEAESIAAYLERVEIFFQANDIAAYKAGACVFQRRVRKDILLASEPDSAKKVARHNVGSLVQDTEEPFLYSQNLRSDSTFIGEIRAQPIESITEYVAELC